jgi:hypothetical protein
MRFLCAWCLQLAAPETQKAAEKYGWRFDDAQPEVDSKGRILQDVPVAAIRRPLGRTRGNGEFNPCCRLTPQTPQSSSPAAKMNTEQPCSCAAGME